MSGQYRVEVSPNNRAACQATKCKADNVKILKGEIRQAVSVQFQEHQSFKYRHWGCVTPQVIHHWNEKIDGDLELVDGLDGMPEEAQEKVKKALADGHVADEEWNGDAEMNRYNAAKPSQGMFVKTPKKKVKADEDDGDDRPSEKPAKKRSRSKKGAVEDDEDEAPPAKMAKAKSKNAAKTEDAGEDVGEEPSVAAPAKKPAKKSKKAIAEEAYDEPEAAAAPAVKEPKAKKPKKPVSEEADEAPAPQKTGRGKKAKPAEASDEPAPDEAVPEPNQPAKGGKKQKRTKK